MPRIPVPRHAEALEDLQSWLESQGVQNRSITDLLGMFSAPEDVAFDLANPLMATERQLVKQLNTMLDDAVRGGPFPSIDVRGMPTGVRYYESPQPQMVQSIDEARTKALEMFRADPESLRQLNELRWGTADTTSRSRFGGTIAPRKQPPGPTWQQLIIGERQRGEVSPRGSWAHPSGESYDIFVDPYHPDYFNPKRLLETIAHEGPPGHAGHLYSTTPDTIADWVYRRYSKDPTELREFLEATEGVGGLTRWNPNPQAETHGPLEDIAESGARLWSLQQQYTKPDLSEHVVGLERSIKPYLEDLKSLGLSERKFEQLKELQRMAELLKSSAFTKDLWRKPKWYERAEATLPPYRLARDPALIEQIMSLVPGGPPKHFVPPGKATTSHMGTRFKTWNPRKDDPWDLGMIDKYGTVWSKQRRSPGPYGHKTAGTHYEMAQDIMGFPVPRAGQARETWDTVIEQIPDDISNPNLYYDLADFINEYNMVRGASPGAWDIPLNFTDEQLESLKRVFRTADTGLSSWGRGGKTPYIYLAPPNELRSVGVTEPEGFTVDTLRDYLDDMIEQYKERAISIGYRETPKSIRR
jgi:hypothetical protein